MKIGDIVIVKEDADWSPDFKEKRKFVVVDLTNRDNYDYILKTYNWPQNLKDEVFKGHNDFVFITESEVKELIILDREFIRINPIEKLVILS